MKLTALKLNGEPLPGSAYELTDDALTIHNPPKEAFEVLDTCLLPVIPCSPTHECCCGRQSVHSIIPRALAG